MSVPRSPGQTVPRTTNHSIYFYFFSRLIAPVACLTLLWGLVTAAVLTGYPRGWRWLQLLRLDNHALAGAAVVGGAAIAVAVATAALMGAFTRRLTRAMDDLAAMARAPQAQAPQAQAPGGLVPRGRPRPSVAQLAEVADAIASTHRSAAASAAAEAALRAGFLKILSSLGKRNQSLLHRQLRIIDTLERQADNPAALADLFTLDHLTTRMRRHAENLTILSGVASGRSWNGPVPVTDVMRAAVSEVEDYTRVTVRSASDEAVTTPAVTDVIHLLAELIENATLFSPSSTQVEVRAEHVANGFAVEVEDRGLGIPPDQLRELNAQLASPPDFDSADPDRLGLFVVGRLAARHGVHVSLAPSPYQGTKAVVVLPEGVVIPATRQDAVQPDTVQPDMVQPDMDTVQPDRGGGPTAERGDGQSVRLNLRAAHALSLAGAVVTGSPGAGARPQALPGSQVQVTDDPPLLTMHGLPRRVRPRGQSQGERNDRPDAAASAASQSPVESPAPDAARSLAASLQSSWRRSRQAEDEPDADAGAAAGDPPSASRDPLAPDSAPE